jgi:CheY-like chemotaxis protein
VVDDDIFVARAIERILTLQYEVTIETSPSAVLTRLHAGERWDVILCDMRMPEMTGLELHRRMGWEHSDQAGRVIFMTGGGTVATGNLPNLVLEKPIDVDVLRTTIEERVRRSLAALPRVRPRRE